MKNTKNILVGAMLAMTIATYANASNNVYKAEEKTKVTGLNQSLPVSLPALDGPAPLKEKVALENSKHTAAQKAAIVGLQLKSNTAK
ncbi:hypothetical protein [Dyadobacter sandarakinus]|uniref:Uncharacterized protein n=1 Tax=Dyadobacter sandarakinus TaxID=2747268 RepID=A0ABX7I344_9BACT|nr:hypothetical protein [Dyadobacter sandarakinus]QRQ99657.1 hypothetical protein HWI92_01365 [Dyadobacter sandarakinus]